jgi:hypothetical protein
MLFAVYINILIDRLRKLTVGCTFYGEFFGCLLYADDIVLYLTPWRI